MKAQIVFNLTLEQLRDLHVDTFKKIRLLEETEGISQPKENKFLTLKQFANRLQISSPTLRKHAKSGFISTYCMDGNIYFKLDDLEQSLKNIEKMGNKK